MTYTIEEETRSFEGEMELDGKTYGYLKATYTVALYSQEGDWDTQAIDREFSGVETVTEWNIAPMEGEGHVIEPTYKELEAFLDMEESQ